MRVNYIITSMSKKEAFQFRKNRLQSFTEGVKVGKSLKQWSNTKPEVNHLVDCGFYYSPSKKHPDQVTCFWCGKKERNLEQVESMSRYHLSNQPGCPFSLIASLLEQYIVDSDKETFWQRLEKVPRAVYDPHCSQSVLLRTATFKNLWEFKTGPVSAKNLAAAGFYYSPVEPGSDRVICMYCDCPLEEWDALDNPLEEHKKNSFSYCYFLETIGQDIALRDYTPEPISSSASYGTPLNETLPEIEHDSISQNFSRSPSLTIEPKPKPTAVSSEFDAFDFSIEDLENQDQGTIFIQKDTLPKTYGRKGRPRKPLMVKKEPIRNSKSLVLQIEYEDEVKEKAKSIEKANSREAEDLISDVEGDHDVPMYTDSDDDIVLVKERRLRIEDSSPVKASVDEAASSNTTKTSVAESDSSFNESVDSIDDSDEDSDFAVPITPVRKTRSGALPKKRKAEPKTQRASESKKKARSDDSMDLDSEKVAEILNSPKKGRKMKVFARKAAAPTTSIFDDSNQNIGDYDESNLSFLENDVHTKKPNRSLRSKSPFDLDTQEKVSKFLPQKKDVTETTNNDILGDISELRDEEPGTTIEGAIELPETQEEHMEPEKGEEPESPGENIVEIIDSDVEMQEPTVVASASPEVGNSSSIYADTVMELEPKVPQVVLANDNMHPDFSASAAIDNTDQTEVPINMESSPVVEAPDIEEQEMEPEELVEEERVYDLTLSPETYDEYKKDLANLDNEFIEASVAEESPEKQVEKEATSVDAEDVTHEEKDATVIEDSASEAPQLLSYTSSVSASPTKTTSVELRDSSRNSSITIERRQDRSTLEGPASPPSSPKEREDITEPIVPVETTRMPLAEIVVEQENLPAQIPSPEPQPEVKETNYSHKSPRPSPREPLKPRSSPKTEAQESTPPQPNSSPKSMMASPVEESSPPKEELRIEEAVETNKRFSGQPSDRESSLGRLSGSFLNIEASTPEGISKKEPVPTLRPVSIDAVMGEIQTLLETIEYLAEVTATNCELHDDTNGILTDFIAAMPEEEENMSIQEWMKHNATTCGRTVRDIALRLITAYGDEFDKVIAHVEKMKTLD